jgi:hypothetical protein
MRVFAVSVKLTRHTHQMLDWGKTHQYYGKNVDNSYYKEYTL